MAFQTADVFERQVIRTGNHALDEVLDGGLELGLMHLLYGTKALNRDLLRMVVHAQLPIEQGGLATPSIIIDSNNILKIDQMTDSCYQAGLEPEEVMDNVFITRAFNSSQTYALIMEELEGFIERVPAKLLIVSGLADIYHREGLTAEGMQQLTVMTNRLMAFTLKQGIATVISAMPTERAKKTAVGGRALNSCAQVHVFVEETPSRVVYNLVKHPVHRFRRKSITKPGPRYATTLPLEYFIEELREDRD